MNVRIAQEVKAEIKKLKEMKPYVRRRTFFGDDNHEGIEAQIRVLEEDMEEEDIHDAWPLEGEDEDDATDENESVRGHALDALNWLEGTEEEPPSESWAPLDSRNTEKIQ